MNIQTTDADVWWIALPDEIRAREGLAWQKMFEEIQKVFRFAGVPTQLPMGNQGYEFNEGSFQIGESLFVVTRLAIFNDGINIKVPSTTDTAEKALQVAMDLFRSLGVREPTTPPLHYYLSTIVADFEKPLTPLFPVALLESVSSAMPVAGETQIASFRLNFDATRIPGRIGPLNPTNFLIERRGGAPYDLNRFFCQANTTTEKHVALLERLESLV